MKRLATILAVIAIASGVAKTALAAPPLETYGKLPAIEMIDLSPDGKRLAFVGSVKGVRTLSVLEIGGAVLAATPVGSTKVRDIAWAGNDIVLVSNTSTQNWGYLTGGENMEVQEVVAIDLVGKKSFPVLKNARTVSSVFGNYGVRQIDGRWYGFYGSYETVKGEIGEVNIKDYSLNLYRIDLLTGAALKIADGRDDADDWFVGTDGKIMANATYARGSGTWRLLAGTRQLLARQDPFDHSSIIGMGRTPNTVLVRPVEAENGTYVEVNLDSGAPQPLANSEKMSSFVFDRRTHQLIGMSADDHRDIHMFDPKTQARVLGVVKAFPKYDTTVISWSDDFSRLIAFTDGGDDPGTYWLVDIATGKASILGAVYQVDGKDVGPVEMIDYKAADGTDLQGVLTLPPGKTAKNLPIVVLPHGGPAARDNATFDWWAQAFASRGYAVFQPNFRGSIGYGQAFREAGYGEWGRKMQTDISDGVKALADKGVIDPKRACIVGASYGGYAATAGVTVQQGLYKCAVSYGGVVDLAGMLKENELNDPSTRYWKSFMGAKGPNDPILKTLSPSEQASKADAPVLLIYGKDDTVVPPKQSQTMERELKKAGKPVELVVIDHEDHWLSSEAGRTAMLKASVAFVEKHNPPN